MSLQTQITALAQRIATEINTMRTERGLLTALTTTDKSSVVGAINELVSAVSASSGIDDGSTGTGSTWSSQKITDELIAYRDAILGGASAAYDTLLELETQLTSNTGGIAALTTSINNRVRHDVNNQGLDSTQQANARTNIGAVSTADVGNVNQDFVSEFNTALA